MDAGVEPVGAIVDNEAVLELPISSLLSDVVVLEPPDAVLLLNPEKKVVGQGASVLLGKTAVVKQGHSGIGVYTVCVTVIMEP
jgi:hypothetical protein